MTVLRPQEQLRLLPKYSSGGWIISQNRWRPRQQDQFNLLLQSKTKHMDTQYKSVLCVQFPSIKKLSELTSAMIEKNDLYGQASLYFWFAWLRPDTLFRTTVVRSHTLNASFTSLKNNLFVLFRYQLLAQALLSRLICKAIKKPNKHFKYPKEHIIHFNPSNNTLSTYHKYKKRLPNLCNLRSIILLVLLPSFIFLFLIAVPFN